MNYNITWTPAVVEEWLKIAAMVDKSLPPVRPSKVLGQKWDIVREWYELLWDTDTSDIKPHMQPTNEQVSMWEEVVLRWFRLIDNTTDKKIVWLRACGVSWTKIGKKVHLSRQSVALHHKNAIDALAKKVGILYTKISNNFRSKQ